MESEDRIAALRIAIVKAFQPSDPLPEHLIALHQCDECDALRADLSGIAWDRMPLTLTEKHYGSLPLLSSHALAHFLPAYLLYALGHFTLDSSVTEFLIYQLAPGPPTTEDDIEWHREKLRYVSREQIGVLNEFLLLVEGDETFRVSMGDIGPGRRRTLQYWEDRWNA